MKLSSSFGPLFSLFCLVYSSAGFATQKIQPAQRVISLAPHTTELAYAAGLGPAMIAVSDYSDYPEQAKNLEKVANYHGIKLERIIALKPDLILAWEGGNSPRELKKLEQLGMTVFYSKPTTLDDIAIAIEELSQWATDPSYAQKTLTNYRADLEQLRSQYAHKRKVPFFYQLSTKPMISVAGSSWPSQVFTLCQGENIFQNSPSPYPQVSEEQVVVRQPEVIFTSEHAVDNNNWHHWKDKLPAQDKQQIWSLHSDWLNRPTPRTLNAVKQVCQYLDTARKAM